MKFPVVDIVFEEVGVEFDGLSVGSFTGVASVTSDGEVVSLAIDALTTSALPNHDWQVLNIDVDPRATSFQGTLARYLAQAIESRYAPEIGEELDAWEEHRRSGHREYNADERSFY